MNFKQASLYSRPHIKLLLLCAENKALFGYNSVCTLKVFMLWYFHCRCNPCNISFFTKEEVEDHQKSPDHGGKCQFCNRYITPKETLLAHEKGHADGTLLSCPICPQVIMSTVFSLIEAPGAKTRFRGASIFSNKCTKFQNKHDKETAVSPTGLIRSVISDVAIHKITLFGPV